MKLHGDEYVNGKIIDGKGISSHIIKKVRQYTEDLGFKPIVAVLQVGDDPASSIFIKTKKRACEEANILLEHYHLPEAAEINEIIGKIGELNKNTEYNGILVQLPLPDRSMEPEILNSITPEKDIDCLHPYNQGRLRIAPIFEPAMCFGVTYLLDRYIDSLEGVDVVIINHSYLIGTPLSASLQRKNATVQVCNEYTSNLSGKTKEVDVLISAVGKNNFTIDENYVKEGSFVIDCGFKYEDNKPMGDIDIDSVKNIVGLITPVPGGIGPITTAMVAYNTYKAACLQSGTKFMEL